MKRITFVKSCMACNFRVYDSEFGNDCVEYSQPIKIKNGKYVRCEGCREDFPSGHIKITMEDADEGKISVLTENNVRIDQHIIHEENPDEIWVVCEIKSGHNIVIEQWDGFGRDLVIPTEFKKWRVKECS